MRDEPYRLLRYRNSLSCVIKVLREVVVYVTDASQRTSNTANTRTVHSPYSILASERKTKQFHFWFVLPFKSQLIPRVVSRNSVFMNIRTTLGRSVTHCFSSLHAITSPAVASSFRNSKTDESLACVQKGGQGDHRPMCRDTVVVSVRSCFHSAMSLHVFHP